MSEEILEAHITTASHIMRYIRYKTEAHLANCRSDGLLSGASAIFAHFDMYGGLHTYRPCRAKNLASALMSE